MNAHVHAVVPGVTVSVHTVLSQLEREPGEFIVDAWVVERATFVAEQHFLTESGRRHNARLEMEASHRAR